MLDRTASTITATDKRLQSFVERIQRKHEERRDLASDISDIFKEAKGVGYDVKALRETVRIVSSDATVRRELESLVDVYLTALGETR